MKNFILLVVLALCSLATAQTTVVVNPPSPDPVPGTTTSFSIPLSAVTLPGGHSSIMGMSTGIAFTITQSFDVKQSSILSGGMDFYGFGSNYRFPVISTALNNISPNTNFLAFQFYVDGAVGGVYSTAPQSHWGFYAGGGVDYFLNNAWSLGGKIDWVHFPTDNLQTPNNSYMVIIGPKIHF